MTLFVGEMFSRWRAHVQSDSRVADKRYMCAILSRDDRFVCWLLFFSHFVTSVSNTAGSVQSARVPELGASASEGVRLNSLSLSLACNDRCTRCEHVHVSWPHDRTSLNNFRVNFANLNDGASCFLALPFVNFHGFRHSPWTPLKGNDEKTFPLTWRDGETEFTATVRASRKWSRFAFRVSRFPVCLEPTHGRVRSSRSERNGRWTSTCATLARSICASADSLVSGLSRAADRPPNHFLGNSRIAERSVRRVRRSVSTLTG